MKKNKTVKVMALLALLGIVVSVVGTALVIIFGNNREENSKETISVEKLQEMIDNGTIKTGTGKIK